MKRHSEKSTSWSCTQVHFGVIGFCTFFLLSLLAQHVRFHEMNWRLIELDQQRTALEEEQRRLSSECETLGDPVRIRAAATELGMITPPSTRILNLEKPAP